MRDELSKHKHEKLNYVEFPCRDLSRTSDFFQQVFNWQFEAFGTEYIAFSDQGLDGGFFKSEQSANSNQGSALLVFYSHNLESTLNKVVEAGGQINMQLFDFPGGRRFHFLEPSGNEFAVWSDKAALQA